VSDKIAPVRGRQTERAPRPACRRSRMALHTYSV